MNHRAALLKDRWGQVRRVWVAWGGSEVTKETESRKQNKVSKGHSDGMWAMVGRREKSK